ncbi:GGDEF domain-containing protein [Pseudobutyrivibrio xylanivorans]|uniref:Diguanylate cyclase (GGDEF) domain-containing protein n=1 Tax=Pseudobutyrivibrio xylanivorans DSM 14809 TaxID=1123012 RepID=A0A1M6I0D8_PSEXY|nr:GGDEF domain-containing protein [Pseudobutyrivibrio xylanivorans]SHJ27841.1 diguanylate cyclase (GGDEF) domain-containing protein [Pseudobutyrivibrio xylanivorans DSM 14809]
MNDVLLSKKSPEVVELIKQMEAVRKKDNEKYVDLACDLFDMAQEEGNEDLRNFASCTLGDALCQNNEFSQAVYYLSAGLQGIINTDEYRLICRCYNEMGIIMRSEGHFITSQENYINSIDMARAHRMYFQEAIACGNFASLCEEMGARNEALEYHYRAIECCQFIEDENLKNVLLVAEYAQLTKLYIYKGDLIQAKTILDEMNRLDREYPDEDNFFAASLARWYYYDSIKERELSEKYKDDCVRAFYALKDVVVFFDEIEALVLLLLEKRAYVELEKIFEHIDLKAAEDEVVNIRLRLESWKIKMYEAIDDRVKIAQSCYNYYRYDSIKSRTNRKSFTTTLRLKTELVQQKTKNLFLSAQAETDSLTGLANRMKLNNVIDELFMMASEKGQKLGVEMMDVDFFKQVNDNYGHAKGDQLLAAMGRGFREINDEFEKVFVARYGGDEFILYYYDMEDDEIIVVSDRIRDMVAKIGKELEIDKISVSQGIVNRVPEPANRAWDYLNAADFALYYVKENGKNNVKLIHNVYELENYFDSVFKKD